MFATHDGGLARGAYELTVLLGCVELVLFGESDFEL